MTGLTLGIIGLALTALLCGIGSGLGLKATATASAGVIAPICAPDKNAYVVTRNAGVVRLCNSFYRSVRPSHNCQFDVGRRFGQRFSSADYGAGLERAYGLLAYDDRRYGIGNFAR